MIKNALLISKPVYLDDFNGFSGQNGDSFIESYQHWAFVLWAHICIVEKNPLNNCSQSLHYLAQLFACLCEKVLPVWLLSMMHWFYFMHYGCDVWTKTTIGFQTFLKQLQIRHPFWYRVHIGMSACPVYMPKWPKTGPEWDSCWQNQVNSGPE